MICEFWGNVHQSLAPDLKVIKKSVFIGSYPTMQFYYSDHSWL